MVKVQWQIVKLGVGYYFYFALKAYLFFIVCTLCKYNKNKHKKAAHTISPSYNATDCYSEITILHDANRK